MSGSIKGLGPMACRTKRLSRKPASGSARAAPGNMFISTVRRRSRVEQDGSPENAITKARKSENTKKTARQTVGFFLNGFFRAFVFSCFRDGISRDVMPFNADPFVRRAWN